MRRSGLDRRGNELCPDWMLAGQVTIQAKLLTPNPGRPPGRPLKGKTMTRDECKVGMDVEAQSQGSDRTKWVFGQVDEICPNRFSTGGSIMVWVKLPGRRGVRMLDELRLPHERAVEISGKFLDNGPERRSK